MYRTHNCGELRLSEVGQSVTLCGWVQRTRKMGGMTFVDLRDRYGITQLVFNEETDAALCAQANKLGREYVIQVTGTVNERYAKNDKMPTGDIELLVDSLTVLNASEVPPFTIEENTDGGDDLRMKYRYLDLRRASVRANLELRHKFCLAVREYLDNLDFMEIETPVLVGSTPEGARDFIVPSRMNPGQFYALPQSPQTLKQLLMVAGMDRYFQIVKCFRDEDLRADRQPEFTQIDCEMSFVEQDDIINTFEGLTKYLFKKVRNYDLGDEPFLRMPWHEAMRRFGSDKPDMRFGMEFVELMDVLKGSGEFSVFNDANYIGGIGVVRGVGITIKDMNCIEGRVGHPDASLGHSRDNSQVTVDPGYWLWTSRYLPQIGIRFLNNHFGFAARKVCDAHTGNNIQIIGNSGKCLYYGTGVVIEETFAMDSTKGGRSESTSFEYQESNIVIKDNEFICGLNGIFLINGATGVKARKDKNLWWLRANVTVQNNRIYAPRGIPCNFGHNRFTISDNSCTFALPFGEPFGLRYLSAINIKKGGQNYSPDTKIVITGGGDGARGGAATCTVTNGVITAIRITATGTKYGDAKSISVQAVDPTGQGSGAEFEAFCNSSSYAYMIGAEARYGTIDASYIVNNTARNSPHGNYDRQFLSANLTGCTVRDNRLDITPYTKGTNPALPYVSDRDYVHRSGVASQGFYPTGTHTDCRHDNNKTWNQMTGIYADYVFRNTETQSGTSAGSSSVSRADVDALIQKAVEAAIAPFKAKLEAAPSGGGGGATGQPASPNPAVATPAAPSNIKFSLANAEVNALEASADGGTAKLISAITSEKAGDPVGWTGAVAEEDGKKVIKAVAGENGRGHRYLETSGVSATSDTQTTLVMPFKVVRGGSDGGAFIVLPMMGGSSVVGSAVVTHGAEGFTLRVPEGSTIDGKGVRATDVFAYGKWHVAKIQISAAFEKIRFGTNNLANTGRSITIGAGFEILQGDVSKADEKANALMTSYSVTAA